MAVSNQLGTGSLPLTPLLVLPLLDVVVVVRVGNIWGMNCEAKAKRLKAGTKKDRLTDLAYESLGTVGMWLRSST